MIKAVCIEKSSSIYKLQDEHGLIREIVSNRLKQAIKSGKIDVINLKLTSDNRLIEKKTNKDDKVFLARIDITTGLEFLRTNKDIYFKSNANINNIETKANILGLRLDKIKDNLYILEDKEKIGLISDIQLSLTNNCSNLFRDAIVKSISFKGICSSNVKHAEHMFNNCVADKIDMRDFDTSGMISMASFFTGCKANELILGNMNTDKVNNMQNMFYACEAKEIDITEFSMIKQVNMDTLFYNCGSKLIDRNKK